MTHFQFSSADLVKYMVQDNKKIFLLLEDLLNSISIEEKNTSESHSMLLPNTKGIFSSFVGCKNNLILASHK